MSTVNVFTKEKVLALLGDTIIGANVVGNDLIVTTRGGATINAGNVRGPSANTPHASTVAYSPTGTIAASNVQAAITELDADATVLRNGKVNAVDLKKMLTGRATLATTANNEVSLTVNFSPSNTFTAAPRVFVMVDTTAAQNIGYYGIKSTTATSFVLYGMRYTTSNTGFNWMAIA